VKRLVGPLLVVAAAGCGGGGDTPLVDAGPAVTIPSLTVRRTASYQCDPEGGTDFIDCGDYRFTFSVENGTTSPVARIDNLRITMAGRVFDTHADVTCPASPWTAAAGENSGVIDLQLYWYYQITGVTTLEYPCPDTERTFFFGEPMPPAPGSGPVTLEVSGVLGDATFFRAVGQASILP
jgi:hypothetical protein